MMRQLVSIAAAIALPALCSPPPQAWALSMPVVDPAALPADGPPGPDQEMRQNGQCSFFGALPGFDPAAVPPSQDMLNLPEAWKTSRGRGVAVAGNRLPGDTSAAAGRTSTPEATTSTRQPTAWSTATDTGRWSPASSPRKPGADGFSGVAPEAALVSIRQSSAQWSPQDSPRAETHSK